MIDDDNAPLFADVPRHNSSEADEEESTWAFLDRVDDPAIQRVRRLMNTWFARYPVEERNGLRGRLTSGDNVEFHGAWFELYLHELHRRLGFLITVEPTLPAVTTRPDFLLARNEDRVFLEATVIGDRQQAGRAGRIARVVAAVNRTTSPDFKLLFDIEAEGEGSPPMREVRRQLERWLATLDWAEERGKQVAFNFEAMRAHTERVGDWEFSFRAWPRSPETRGRPGPTIAAGPSDGATFDHGGTLLDRLTEKATKYGTPSEPVVIAVRLDRLGANTEDVTVALLGPTIARIDPANRATTAATARRGTGLFRHESGRWRNQHVAGVLVWDIELRPWSIAREMPTLWRHPQPDHELPRSLPWHSIELDLLARPRFLAGTFDPVRTFDLPDIAYFEDQAYWPGTFKFGDRE